MLGIIDVREWQAVIDLVTAKPVKRDEEFLQPLKKLAERFPYPGDRDNAGSKWTIEAAEAVVNHYHPGWLFLGFTQPFFSSTYGQCTIETRKNTAKIIFDYILGFAKKHSFYSLIVSTGGLVPLKGYIVLPELKGNLQSSAWCHNMAGVYQSEPGDEAVLAQEPHIRSIIKKEDFAEEYKDTKPAYIKDFPDYLLIAEDGWHFKGLCSNNRALYNIEKYNSTLPVYSEIGYPGHIEGICSLMEDALDQGKKVLLAVIEGLDEDDFMLPYQNIDNCRGWYAYQGYTLYHTLVTGKPFYQCTHPPIYDMSARRKLPLRYPMSAPHTGTICEDSLGRRAKVPTAAVGSRSITTHAMVNADLMLECYIRAQANMGVLVAVNEDRYHANLNI
ncbi:MAG: hypothetical protein GX188_02885 [Syntrophomonadaceae bacterium]|jgi:hypothetical protein|nr:hypothetical protein [Thermoanaerobacterales bacterium]NLN20930.1 hypothetical protein [Syntrophomonadaceae bacterium]